VNLISNAVKFTEQGEVVLRVSSKPDGEGRVLIHFAVSDTGIGIADDVQQSIFDPFTQADSSTTRKFGGTGLGLTIASQLTALMHGRIWVESQAGLGSTFNLELPFDVVADPAPAAVIPNESILLGQAVLIVDDNATNRWILTDMVSRWGMVPTTVDSADAAIKALDRAQVDEDPFELVLLDYQMPNVDGVELAGRIKEMALERDGEPATMVLMLSSVGQGLDSASCAEVGITAALTKPVRQTSLRDTILLALTGRADARPVAPLTLPSRGRAGSAAARPLRLLLAEDNPVNRRYVSVILEKHGHLVESVENGRMAVDAAQRDAFDAVLMDVQMPEMDGLAAAALIRAGEQATGRHLPIIALTAHASERDRQMCLDSGMDAYLTKPVRADDLLHLLSEVTDVEMQVPPGTPAGLAAEALLARVDGDHDLLAELAGLLRELAPDLLADIRDGVAAGEPYKVERAAHQLRGSISSFGATDAAQTANMLEQMGRRGELTGGAQRCAHLERQVRDLIEHLDRAICYVAA
jgi:CheY-like chemotaxis protein